MKAQSGSNLFDLRSFWRLLAAVSVALVGLYPASSALASWESHCDFPLLSPRVQAAARILNRALGQGHLSRNDLILLTQEQTADPFARRTQVTETLALKQGYLRAAAQLDHDAKKSLRQFLEKIVERLEAESNVRDQSKTETETIVQLRLIHKSPWYANGGGTYEIIEANGRPYILGHFSKVKTLDPERDAVWDPFGGNQVTYADPKARDRSTPFSPAIFKDANRTLAVNLREKAIYEIPSGVNLWESLGAPLLTAHHSRWVGSPQVVDEAGENVIYTLVHGRNQNGHYSILKFPLPFIEDQGIQIPLEDMDSPSIYRLGNEVLAAGRDQSRTKLKVKNLSRGKDYPDIPWHKDNALFYGRVRFFGDPETPKILFYDYWSPNPNLKVWDLRAGKVVVSFPVGQSLKHNSVYVHPGQFLLVSGSDLFLFTPDGKSTHLSLGGDIGSLYHIHYQKRDLVLANVSPGKLVVVDPITGVVIGRVSVNENFYAADSFVYQGQPYLIGFTADRHAGIFSLFGRVQSGL